LKKSWRKLDKPNPKHLESALVKLRDKLGPLKVQLEAEIARVQPLVDEEMRKREADNGK
jgi:hypothetical protein